MIEPEGDVLYRSATLRPLMDPSPDETDLDLVRSELESLLCDTDLQRLESVTMVLKCMESQQVDTPTLLEIIASALVRDANARYAILAEASVAARADLVREELLRLEHLLLLATRQQRDELDYNVTIN